ncbi:MAG TPA: LysM domain-containing protein, partial [Solidesulfovibrio sp.]|nr:LysM domain-containing protein [Solidesulfovibrio sp.]
ANGMRSGNDLRAGANLTIPGKAMAKVEVPSAPAAPAARSAKDYGTPKPLAAVTPAPAAGRLFAEKAPPPAPTKAQAAASQPAAKPIAAAKAAPEKPAPAKVAPAKAVNYKVGPGETVWGIAKKFNVEPSSLMAWNNMKSPGALQAGSQITIRKE